MNYILEGCVDSVESALIATEGGANRLELCANLVIGGTTPTRAFVQRVKKECKNRCHVLIRPRFGDFCYSKYEFEIMCEEIQQFCELGVEGIVIGALTPDGNLDLKQMEKFCQLAGERSVTLHRCFDVCADPLRTLEEAKQLRLQTILTSGQKNHCLEGKNCIKELVKRSEGKIDIMVGGGVNAEVISTLFGEVRATSYHMSGKVEIESRMHYRKNGISMGIEGMGEYSSFRTDYETIRRAADTLKGLTGGQA
ncbi:MAG: copper homeostasis protein CutC [Lachnospiraceae bacterium]